MKRNDGRAPGDLRPVEIIRGYQPSAEGSVLFQLGGTKVICSATVEYKVPPWLKGKGRGWVTAEYSMLPRSTTVRTMREVTKGRPQGRTCEIQRLIGRSLRSVVEMDKLGEVTIIVDCDVVCADGGTRTAAVTGGFIALYDALSWLKEQKKIDVMPLTDFIAATSVGVIDGSICVDLDYGEDSQADVDLNLVMNGSGGIIEIQGTAEKIPFSRDRLTEMLDLAGAGVGRLIEISRSVLLKEG